MDRIDNLKGVTTRFVLPDSGQGVTGWIDYDRQILSAGLTIVDKAEYLRSRLRMVLFDPLDQILLRSAPSHGVVNTEEMSFLFIGATAICCCIENLGGYIICSHDNNRARFYAFIENYMKDWDSVKEWLWKSLRNMLAHRVSVKNGGFEFMNSDRFRRSKNQVVIVNPEQFYLDFKSGAESYLADVASFKSNSLSQNFATHFDATLAD